MQLTVLGGAGEHGRSSYLLTEAGQHVLLDYGVKKEDGGQYPLVDDMEALIGDLQTVFLSHAHEDHCIALPILYRHGYRGHVWTTRATVQQLPAYFDAWKKYTDQRHIVRPYDDEDEQRICYSYVEDIAAPGQWGQIAPGLDICWGRSGHLPGSIWLTLCWKGKYVFFSGDYTSESQMLSADRPLHRAGSSLQPVQYSVSSVLERSAQQAGDTLRVGNMPYGRNGLQVENVGQDCDGLHDYDRLHLNKTPQNDVALQAANVLKHDNKLSGWSVQSSAQPTVCLPVLPDLDLAIVDAAYGDDPEQQAYKLHRLQMHINDTLQAGGSVLLPVPLYGRGQELLLWAYEQYPDVPLFVESVLLEGMQLLNSYEDWLHEGVVQRMERLLNALQLYPLFASETTDHLYTQHTSRIIFTPDGMLQSELARQHYERLRANPRNRVIFTGHLAKGSLGSKLLQQPPPDGCRIEHICYKVHQGLPDVQQMLDDLNCPPSVLVHATQQRTDRLAAYLHEQGYERIYSLLPTARLEF
ncbi:MBL fold metallo-hydrolase [Paenibacillus sp. SGZ-1009]|uniref:MBL fold metallo-hydrolase n=1 Tax=Paenibacillus campi TaxID=3106031 RepID=UPI002AFF2AE4|nr:MBL fold metallo-hydrolase [Paenibacillus sp. SGZ-1009]